jgi:triosephosphate isomerase
LKPKLQPPNDNSELQNLPRSHGTKAVELAKQAKRQVKKTAVYIAVAPQSIDLKAVVDAVEFPDLRSTP